MIPKLDSNVSYTRVNPEELLQFYSGVIQIIALPSAKKQSGLHCIDPIESKLHLPALDFQEKDLCFLG